MSQQRRWSFLLLILLLCSTSFTFAQTSLTGAVAGVARDSRHAMVAQAQITLRNPDTGEQFTARSGTAGDFRIVGLSPGIYSLAATGEGFAEFRRPSVLVELGRITEIDIVFAPAGTHEAMEIHAEAPAVNTSSPDFSTNLGEAAIENLPINGRRWSDFALLTPTTTLDGDYGLISFRGINGLANNSTVDGADNNNTFFSEERGRTRISYVISPAAVREFQVNTSNYSAQYGRAAGAVINTVTRRGGNRVHGSLFYYIRDNSLGATNPYTVVPLHQPDGQWTTEKFKPLDRRQQFGASIGGPIIKDKLFYFANFDIQRRDFPGIAAAADAPTLFAPPCVIPSHYASMNATDRAQVRQCGTNNSIDELYTLTRNVMPLYTSDATAIAAFQTGLNYMAGLLGPLPRRADHQVGLVKLDYRLNSHHSLEFMYDRLRWNSPAGVQTQPVVNRGIASFGFDGVKVDTLVVRLSSTFGSSMANELRYSWSRDFQYQEPQTPAPGEPVNPNGTAPDINLLSYSSGFSFGTPATIPRRALPNEYHNGIAETLSWAHHRHFFKFGFDAIRVVDEMNNLYAANGEYNYDQRANFIADLCQWQGPQAGSAFAPYCPIVYGYPSYGAPTQYRGYSSFVQGFGSPAFSFHTFDGALFAQDDWRALRRLTLSFGLRYEFELLPRPQAPNALLAGSQSFPSDMNNFGPRFGFALALTSDGRTSLRGGYGLYYGRIRNSLISSALTNTGAQAAQRSYSFKPCYLYATNCLEGPLFPNLIGTDPYGTTNGGNVAVFSRGMQVPQIQQADLTLERQVARHTVVSASFLLSLGRELPNFVDVNLDPASVQNVTYTFDSDYYTGALGPYYGHSLTVPVYTARLDPNFQAITEIRSNINSSYNALVLRFHRTSASGLGFKINYTWAHAIDNGQSSTVFTSSNRNNTLSPVPFTYEFDGVPHYVARPDYGNSRYDIRQRLVASVYWSPRLLRHSQGLLHTMLDHWTVAPVVHISSGRPFSDHVGGYAPISTCAGCTGFMGTGGAQRLPFLGRNSFRYGTFYNADLRLSRRIYFGERGRSVEFLAEAFNVFNHQNITHRISTMYSAYNTTLEYHSDFNTPTSSANSVYRERQLQFALRAHF